MCLCIRLICFTCFKLLWSKGYFSMRSHSKCNPIYMINRAARTEFGRYTQIRTPALTGFAFYQLFIPLCTVHRLHCKIIRVVLRKHFPFLLALITWRFSVSDDLQMYFNFLFCMFTTCLFFFYSFLLFLLSNLRDSSSLLDRFCTINCSLCRLQTQTVKYKQD